MPVYTIWVLDLFLETGFDNKYKMDAWYSWKANRNGERLKKRQIIKKSLQLDNFAQISPGIETAPWKGVGSIEV